MFRGIGAPEPFLPRTFEKGAIVRNDIKWVGLDYIPLTCAFQN